MKKLLLTTFAVASSVRAQTRPNDTSICDYYSSVALGASNASTQYTLLTLLVNTAVIGNYSNASTLAVPGILAQNATYNNTVVNLLPYFDGSLASSNRGGKAGQSMNFLDGGGAAPLKENKPSIGTNSNQYRLLMHLYSFFGTLLGCSDMGQTSFPGYGGETSMYEVHKFMALDAYQVGYFIEQVGLSAASFGVQQNDIEFVAHALQKYFGYKCAPPTDVLPDKGKELQAVCIAKDCPKSPNPTCKAYGKVIEPKNATKTGSATNSSTTASSTVKGVAAQLGVSACSMLMLLATFLVLLG